MPHGTIGLEISSDPADQAAVTEGMLELAADKLADIEQRVREAESRLREVEQSALMGEITPLIAHEINNLLTPIRSHAQLAQSSPEHVSRGLEQIVACVSRAEQIIESLLALKGTAESGGSIAALAAAARSAVACLPSRFQGCQIEIDGDPATTVGMTPASLQQVFFNLIYNAGKAMNWNGSIRVAWSSATWNMISVIVEDSGPGLDLVAMPEKRLETTSDGHGLGLLVCRRLIEQVGGTIEIDSEYDAGARFCIQLPASG